MDGSRRVGMVYPSPGHSPTKGGQRLYGHPSHRGFARAVDADEIVVRFRSLPYPLRQTFLAGAVPSLLASIAERDVYLLENDGVIYTAPLIRRRYPEATVVHLAASDRLLAPTFTRRPDETALTALVRRMNVHVDTPILQRILTRWCDGAIAVSPFVRDRLEEIAGRAFPVRVATPFLTPNVYDAMATIEPDLSGTVAVTVGQWRNHKGFDMLVEAWPRVREHHPDAELHIVGRDHPAGYTETPGVTLRGLVDDIGTELAEASLYVHPAHIEPFGVSVVEAMRAGLPAVVTATTGARCAVEAVDDSLVVPPSPAAIAEGVSQYFETPVDRRAQLARAGREGSDAFNERERTRRFRERLFDLIEEIERDS